MNEAQRNGGVGTPASDAPLAVHYSRRRERCRASGAGANERYRTGDKGNLIGGLRIDVSLMETAKANGIEPYAYLRVVFTELPQATSSEEIEALLPVANHHEGSARVS
jgi:hypothetical protein